MDSETSTVATDRFFHRATNITNWMEDKIKALLRKKGYEIVSMDVSSEVMTRMSKLSVVNTVNLKILDSKNRAYELSGYSSEDKEYDGSSGLGWLISEIKEYEAQAALEFGPRALHTKQEVSEPQVSEALLNPHVKSKTVEIVTVKLECFFAAEASEIKKFLTEPQFVEMWSRSKVENNSVEFEGVVLRDIQVQEDILKMEYKFENWNAFSRVNIKVNQVGSDTRVQLSQENVPIKDECPVRAHWEKRIFGSISQLFGCAIKKIN